jgi:hypothetical protein
VVLGIPHIQVSWIISVTTTENPMGVFTRKLRTNTNQMKMMLKSQMMIGTRTMIGTTMRMGMAPMNHGTPTRNHLSTKTC